MPVSVRGINYDTGCEVVAGRLSRPVFELRQVDAEFADIADGLNCAAVRIAGNNLERLEAAADRAAAHGLQLWLSPASHDRTQAEALLFLEQAAVLSGNLQRRGCDVVLVVGWESTAFLKGMVRGGHTLDRLATLASIPRLLASTARHGSFNRQLNKFLSRAVDVGRSHFDGALTYASGMWEEVDWEPFDIIGVDVYRDASNASSFSTSLAAHASGSKPFAALEFGCCTYRGAADRGARGWMIADPVRRVVRPGIVRDEDEQAAYLMDLYLELERCGATATFPFTYASYSYPTLLDGPDLDVGAFGIVRLVETRGNGSPLVETCRDPKLAYKRLQALYRGLQPPPE